MVVAFEVQLTNCWTLNGGQVWELISRRVQLKGWRGHIILRFSSRSLTRFPQQILGNSISKEMETTLDTPEYSSLLNKAYPKRKIFYHSLSSLGKGKYTTSAHCTFSHGRKEIWNSSPCRLPCSPKKRKCKLRSNSGHRINKRLKPNNRVYIPSTIHYHHITRAIVLKQKNMPGGNAHFRFI